jgi:hypothetical protein
MKFGLLIVSPNTKTSTSNIVGVTHNVGVDNGTTFDYTSKIVGVTYIIVNTLNGSIMSSAKMVSDHVY